MRASWVLSLLIVVTLAGCAEDTAPAPSEGPAESFDDLDIEVQEDTGIILGVVVDEAIVPVVEARVVLTTAGGRETTTDEQGRFAFEDVEPGNHVLTVSKINHQEVQSTVSVEAGVEDVPVLKVRLERLYAGEPYMSGTSFEGFLACVFQVGVAFVGLTAPCVTDFTQVAGPVCGTGCFPELRTIMGDARDTTYGIDDGWQTHIVELTWDPSAQGTSESLGLTLRDEQAPGTTHHYAQAAGKDPISIRLESGEVHPSQAGEESKQVPGSGYDSIIAFVSAEAEDLPASASLQQDFEMFLHTFYFGKPPEGWGILNGDENPF